MKPRPLPSTVWPLNPIFLAALLFSLFSPASPGLGQTSGEVRNPTLAKPTAMTLENLEAKWRRVSTVEVEKAAMRGEAEAQYIYGVREWRAARADNDLAFRWSAAATANGTNLSELEKASARTTWEAAPEADLVKSAKGDNREAQWFLGQLQSNRAHERGRRAFDWIKKSAAQSLVPAEFAVGSRYLGLVDWLVIEPDIAEGLQWMKRSADHGSPHAQLLLADCYRAGALVAPDVTKTIEYLRQAATQEFPEAQYELAIEYANGNGQPRDDGETPIALLRKAAKGGQNVAMHELADRYRIGLGVTLDHIAAIRYYQAAQQADHEMQWQFQSKASALFDLVDESFQPKYPISPAFVDFAGTLSRYLKATKNGDGSAAASIGRCYMTGRFVPRDFAEACRWFNVAAQRGDSEAAKERDRLKSTLSPDQLTHALEPPGT